MLRERRQHLIGGELELNLTVSDAVTCPDLDLRGRKPHLGLMSRLSKQSDSERKNSLGKKMSSFVVEAIIVDKK